MKGIRILLVDNEPGFLKTRQEILQTEGYEVVTASSPEEAERLLKKDSFALAIVDLRLRDDDDEADKSGLALIRNVAPEVPKIMITAYPSVEVARRALKGSLEDMPAAVDLLVKQDSQDTFLRAVSSIIQKYTAKKKKGRPWLTLTLIIFALIVVVSFVLVFFLDQGIKQVIITVIVGVILEVVAALLVKFLLDR